MTETKETLNAFPSQYPSENWPSPLDTQWIASGEALGFHIFNANSGDHLGVVTVPGNSTDYEARELLDFYKQDISEHHRFPKIVELAHVSVEAEEAREVADHLTRIQLND